MSDREFDPYHQWLGVPPKDQPADYYRLLGVDRFESDPNVISSAADRQMTHVRGFQSGPRAALAEKMLNKLSSARVCLLDTQKKASYDAKLKQHLAKKAAKQPLQEAEPLQVKPAAQTKAPPTQPKKAGNSWLPVVAVGCAAVVIVVVAFALLRKGEDDDNPTTVAQGDTPADFDSTPPEPAKFDPPEKKPEKGPVLGEDLFKDKIEAPISPPDKPVEPNPEQTPPTPVETEKPVPEPGSETPVGTATDPEPEKTPTGDPIQPENKPDEPVTTTTTEPVEEETTEPKRLSVPDAATQKKTLGQLKRVYEAEFDAAKTPETRVKLAEVLLEQATKLEGSPNALYVVLRETRDQAVEAGALGIAEDAVGQMVETFEVDAIALQVELMIDISKKAQSTDQRKDAANAALEVVQSALAEDRYDEAEQVAKLAGSLAGRARDLELRKKVQVARQEVTRLAKLGAAVSRARKSLSLNSNDPKANLTLGVHLCLAKGDWKAGLAHLAKGSDASLKAAAAQDLAAPEDAKDQLALANAWYDLAKEDEDYTGFYTRAGLWYEQAVEKLQGLPRTGAERRVAEIAKMDLDSPGAEDASSTRRNAATARGTATGGTLRRTVAQQSQESTFSPDGKTVAVTTAGGVRFYDVQTDKWIDSINKALGAQTFFFFYPDGLNVALRPRVGGAIRIVDLRTAKEKFSLAYQSKNPSNAVAISPDGKVIAVGDNPTVTLLDADDGNILGTLTATGYTHGLAFTSDSKVVAAVGYGRGCWIWEVKTGRRLASLKRGVAPTAVDFSPDSKLMAVSGGRLNGKDIDLAIYNIAGKEWKTLEGHTNDVKSVAFSPDGNTLASGSLDGTIRLWDPATGKQTGQLEPTGYTCDFSPDGRILVTSGGAGVHFWELEFGKRKRAK